MRRILAVLLASSLAFTATATATTTASAADLGMPVKAPPVVAPPPPEFDWLPLLGLLVIGGIAACIALCPSEHEHFVSPGGTLPTGSPAG